MSDMPQEIHVDLGNDYAEIRDQVSKLCENFPGEYWRDLEKQPVEGSYPTEFINALTEAGYLAALIPEEYGGAGLPLRGGAVILETINAMGGVASAGHAQMYTMGTILRHGTPEQKQKYLPGIASGELRLQAFGVTEPTSGSDTTQIKTRAERSNDGYVINGQKVWTSRALHSDLMLLIARTTPLDQVEKRHHGISTFLIDLREAKQNGCTINPIEAMINHNTCEVFFDNVLVPADALIGEEGKGFRYILDGMNAERCLTASEGIGNGRYFLRRASEYAREREVFGRPIGKNQGIQFPLAQAHAELEAADLMVRKATAMFEAGLPCGAEANMARLLSAEAAWKAAEACFTTFGGFAFASEYDIERKWRDARLGRIAPISPNLILSFIAQHVLGLPKSY
ncbi:acyl-CoA dehydrogenase [Ruegeria sp. HKCCD4884]|uniref:acyl-CoA dehydrogenase family protein n=1 Tax=Ruegeria sp. HKCCD4884 TaxID=2683022 RepID=UPI0019F2A1D5|nr:acyl-CoA dehydrogenase family protein [Ruegeria sp. HKCCD4884]NOD95292.1 acyl-CoA dehydrogenase [Ruegeria sp. HKCCD4884]